MCNSSVMSGKHSFSAVFHYFWLSECSAHFLKGSYVWRGSNVAHMCHLGLRPPRSLFLCSRLLFLFSSSCSGSILKIKDWVILMFWTRTEAFLHQCQTTLVLYFFKTMLVTSAHPHMFLCSDSQPAGRDPYGGYRAPSWRSPKTFWKPRYLRYNP